MWLLVVGVYLVIVAIVATLVLATVDMLVVAVYQ